VNETFSIPLCKAMKVAYPSFFQKRFWRPFHSFPDSEIIKRAFWIEKQKEEPNRHRLSGGS